MKKNRRSYSIEHYENDKGLYVETRRNVGFSPIELLGVLERIQLEIINQINSQEKKPDVKKLYADGHKINPKMLEGK